MTHPTDNASLGRRAGRALKRLVVTALVLALAGATVVLLSQLNARTYALAMRDGKLWVLKGRLFPFGTEPFRPGDPGLADAYAPLELEGTAPADLEAQRFSDRDAVDRALFELIEPLAKSRVISDDPIVLERGLYYLRRAERLAGLSEEQRRSLAAMKAEVAFYQARTKLEDAQRLVSEGLSQLRHAAESKNRHARSANQMLTAVEPQAKALEEALRAAVHSLSAPAAQPEPPAGAPGGSAPPPGTPPP